MLSMPIDIEVVKGFLDPEEGEALYNAAMSVAHRGPGLEIGGYCGKSAVYLGLAFQDKDSVFFSVDHHRGSEENQPGWDYHDPDLWDQQVDAMDTLPVFRQTMRVAQLEKTVCPIVGRSERIGAVWTTPLAFLFIDGGHTEQAAFADYDLWSPHVMPGGILAIHDVFPNPADGGRPPFDIYIKAMSSGWFDEIGVVKSLRLLRRL